MSLKSATIFISIVLFVFLLSCGKNKQVVSTSSLQGDTWGEKLGFPKEKRVLILHADDLGMCPEANAAGEALLSKNRIQSGAGMVPCPNFEDLARWYKANPSKDIGLHLTLTSEWQTYRWGPVSDPKTVPGLVDPEGFLWHEVPGVVTHATPQEVGTEIRAQIEKAKSLGIQPGHIDTHMGTVYGTTDFAKTYMNIAMEYQIPAMVIEFTDSVLARFRAEGYPITTDMVNFTSNYSLPKLDDFFSAPAGPTYPEKKQNFYKLVRSLKPGITEIIFHPSIETDNLKTITNSWQQRVWEAQMFDDPEVIQFLKDEGVLFTNWKDMMKRFKERKAAG